MLGAIVLAAGAGIRMGGPKALLLVDGRPLIDMHVARFSEHGVHHVVVVADPSFAWRVAQIVRTCSVIARATPDPAASLAAGLAALDPACDRVWVAPVDVLPARLATLQLLAAAMLPGVDAVTPRVGNHGGHPVLVRRALLEARFGDAATAVTLRDVLDATPSRVRVPVDDPHLTHDLDAPSDLDDAPSFA